MHLVWNIFGIVGLTATLCLLGAGTWVLCVVIRNVLVSAVASAALTTSHSANVTLPESQLVVVDGNLVARNQVN